MAEPSRTSALPRRVVLIAIVDVVLGAVAVGEVLIGLADARVSLNLAVLYLPAGIGLLMRSGAFRVGARVLHGLVTFGVPLWIALLIPIGRFEVNLGTVPPEIALGVALLFYAFNVWAFLCLGKRELVELFGRARG